MGQPLRGPLFSLGEFFTKSSLELNPASSPIYRTWANSVAPDETPQSVASHLGLYIVCTQAFH